MAKICTTIEQSQKLLELGIDENTADMYYLYDRNLHKMYGDFPYCREYKKIVGGVDIPAWSLSALLDLMPQRIYDELGCRTFGMAKSWDKCRYQVYYEHKTAYIQKEAETAIDAVFEMIIWLKENKKI